jgi:hypothetical protein
MAKMKIAKKDRPKVKVECLRLLANLQLDPARNFLISGFVDVYLRLNQYESIDEQLAAILPNLITLTSVEYTPLILQL